VRKISVTTRQTRTLIDVIYIKGFLMANNTTGLTRIIKAAGYSWKGFRAAWINEAAFRQEGVAAIVARSLLAGRRRHHPRIADWLGPASDDSRNSQ
jgi:hypothetical protein